MKKETVLGKFLKWRLRNVSNRLFLLLLSIVVGLGAGIAAIILKSLTHYVRHFVVEGFDNPYDNTLFFALPLLGILITVLFFKFLVKEKAGHGVSSILFAISRKGGVVKPSKLYSSMIGSAVTVGLGGSAGLEAPIVSTGSAIGSNLGRLMRLNYKSILLLIGSGSAGAIAAIFNAPIAGVVFALEVLMLDLTLSSLVPILMASVTGTITAKLLLGEEIMFTFILRDQFTASDIPFYILLGLFCGLVSVYFTRVEMAVESKIKKISNEYSRAIWGGIGLGLFIFLFPPLYGEGYSSIKALLIGNSSDLLNNSFYEGFDNNHMVMLVFLLIVILAKPVATALTIWGE
jgi:chloride channel protein, CIC family